MNVTHRPECDRTHSQGNGAPCNTNLNIDGDRIGGQIMYLEHRKEGRIPVHSDFCFKLEEFDNEARQTLHKFLDEWLDHQPGGSYDPNANSITFHFYNHD